MAGADNFGLEERKAAEALEWINAYAKKNNLKFEAQMEGYSIKTVKFGSFQVLSWKGEWSTARNIIKKVSDKLKIKTIESGFHEDRDLISAMFGGGAEYAKVYSSGKLAGKVELVKRSGRWMSKTESFA